MKASDQTVQLCKLIWVFVGCSCDTVGFAVLWLICDFDILQHKVQNMLTEKNVDPDQTPSRGLEKKSFVSL